MIAFVRKFIVVACSVVFTFSGCGYRLASKNPGNGGGRTIAVPTFSNQTTTYRIEQRLTEAVRREFIRRTKYKVVASETGDVLLGGDVLSFMAIPIIFNPQGRGSSYTVFVELNVRLTDAHTGAVLFQNDHWVFREVFELSQNSGEFVPEDTAAVERLARRFASSLVASVLRPNP